MEWSNLHSGRFEKIGFDEELKQLHVRYQDGGYQIFYEVRETEYLGMMRSDDMEAFFDDKIKEKFPSTDVHG
ncbi:KTSC domain-containing protein [Alkalicoccus chagannorensis]|uniref:KTSC domain-containing protein n=1 Tax=Alkalicoccus chagannorensis TaxID=427072 RepID=UPI0014776858|nr:KTSC domain-containing protein [Alkalicoccus chagannorensis]